MKLEPVTLTSKRTPKEPTQIRVNATKIYQFKAKNSEIKDYTLCLANISKDFTINDTKKELDLWGKGCKFLFLLILILLILTIF